MKKPTILVTAATGYTGAATVTQLLEWGYPVRAPVRRDDKRRERLRRLGVEVVVGSMDDILGMRTAHSSAASSIHANESVRMDNFA